MKTIYIYIEAIPQNANHSSGVRIRRQDYNLQRSTEMSQKILEQTFDDVTKKHLYQSDGKAKVWRKKGSAQDLKTYNLICEAR